MNSTLLPTAAVIVLGENVRPLLAPTVTVWRPEVEEELVDAGGAAVAVELVLESAGGPY